MREVFDGLRYIVRSGMQWRLIPDNLLLWHTVHQQVQRWQKTGVFEDRASNLRMLMYEVEDRSP